VTGPRPRAGALTARQREVLALVANGNTNREIAVWRGVTPHSVAEILSAAYRRLGASDRAQAVAIALAVGELGVHQIHIPDQQREDPAA
jgi:DNA-binding CsgD family transcriptional regulator